MTEKGLDAQDQRILDNPVWAALDGPQSAFCGAFGGAALYDIEVSPFAAVAEATATCLDDLASLCTEGRIVALMHREADLPHTPNWRVLESIEVHQMIHSGGSGEAAYEGMSLDRQHVDAMIQLVRLTNPGPFQKRTIELGDYLGVVSQDRLLAMAGERFRPRGWSEVSGVCTHPDAAGRGYARMLVTELVNRIVARGERALLHVRIGSPSEHTAVGVYRRIGFEHHQTLNIAVLQRN